MISRRGGHVQDSLEFGDLPFERVSNFKYLGVDIDHQANSHEEINRRTTAGNKCYFVLVQLFKSRKLFKNTKLRLRH